MKENKYTREDLKYLQSKTLDEKIERTLWTYSRFVLKTGGQCYLSFSGGKDSTVLKHLIEVEYAKRGNRFGTEIQCVYVDTGLEYPEVRKFATSQKNVEVIRPKMNFLEVLQTYGYPLISKEVSQSIYESRKKPDGAMSKRMKGEYINPKTGKVQFNRKKYLPLMNLPIKISNKCCNVMKKYPTKEYESQNKLNKIVATLAEESTLRVNSWLKNGCTAFDKKTGHGRCNPLSTWLEQDVLHYIKREDIDIASVYGDIVYFDEDGNEMLENPLDFNVPLKCTGCDRTGCMFCAYGAHLEKGTTRFQRLKITHPKQYEFMMGGGEWIQENGKQIWQPNKKGLGFANVFNMVNEIYGKDFYRYE